MEDSIQKTVKVEHENTYFIHSAWMHHLRSGFKNRSFKKL